MHFTTEQITSILAIALVLANTLASFMAYLQSRLNAGKIDANHAEAQKGVQDVKDSVNGVQAKLMASTYQQGASDEREKTAQSNSAVK